MSEKRTTTGVVRSRAFSPSTTSNRSISRSGVPSGRTTTWPAALMPKYGLPHAVTWYRSSESSVSHGGLGVNLFAGWSKSVAALRVAVLRRAKDSRKAHDSFATRSRRIADPFAPRACVQSRAAFAGVLHREQQIAGGHAGAAHDDRVIVGDAVLRLSKTLVAVRPRACEAAVAGEIGRERMIARARHVAGDRDRSARPRRRNVPVRARRAVASRRARTRSATSPRVEPHVAIRSRCEVAGPASRNLGGRRQSGGSPRLESAVEHGDRVDVRPSAAATTGATRTRRCRRRRRRPASPASCPSSRAWPRTAPAAAADDVRSSA